MGLVLLLTFNPQRTFDLISPKLYSLSLILLLVLGLTAERPPVLMRENQAGSPDDQYGVANEKYYYFGSTGWVNHFKYEFVSDTAVQGDKVRHSKTTPVKQNVIGFFGYHAGPEIYIIDTHSLADPLRARLPVVGPSRVGHYERVMPLGYEETIASGFKENLIAEPHLNLYYEKLSLIIRGDLLAPGRLREILYFNLGLYDDLVDKYLDAPNPK
jgi:arabinofuranosyltransferase